MACPYVGEMPDCDQMVTAPTNRRGVARLRLDADVRYEFTAFVRDPSPPWPCPGFDIDGSQFYFAVDAFSATPREVPRRASLTIERPDPLECVPVAVTDDAGNPLPAAGLFYCGLTADGSTCATFSFEGADSDGVIRVDVDPAVTYRVSAFYTNSGWPCPAFIGGNGDTFHFSDERDIPGPELALGTTTFVIRRPSPDECD